MTSARRAREIFEAVVDLPSEDQPAAIDRACCDDTTLASNVRAIFGALEGRAEFLSAPTSASEPLPMPSERADDQIGPYKLLQQIGEGGFGVVFMAAQSKPIHRRVALKVIKLGMDTKQVIARFEAERQALAMMNHPNIARVFDAGATNTGRPYFAMELVAGIPITEYCDRERLSIAERVALMIPVCDAVQHAHHKGIIHRDLKPSNVLVTLEDGKPVPKIIDFGIAKAVSLQLTERTLFTEFGQFIGTPEYMSPEQADMPGLDVDARTDVYSLGVMLYELLAGGTPFDGATLRSKGFDEMRRILREDEPPRLSERAATLASSSADVARRRQTAPAELGSLLKKEHEWIVLRCMDKDRKRRYTTPAALAEDLERLLRNEAVAAAPPSTAYRIRKFVRRHRRPVVLALAAAGFTLAGLVGTGLALRRALSAEHELRQQLHRTRIAQSAEQQRADELRGVSEFLTDMLSMLDARSHKTSLAASARRGFQHSPMVAALDASRRGEQLELFDRQWAMTDPVIMARSLVQAAVVDPAVEIIGSRFDDRPIVQARLRYALAKVLTGFDRLEESLELSLAAHDAFRRHLGKDHADTLETGLMVGGVLTKLVRYDEAEAYLLAAVEGLRRTRGDEDRAALYSMSETGELYRAMGRLAQAEEILREAMTISQRARGDGDGDTLVAARYLAFVLQDLGKLDEAETLHRRIVELGRDTYGESGPLQLSMRHNLGFAVFHRGRVDEAEGIIRAVLEDRLRVLGADHASTLTSISLLAEIERVQGRLSEADRRSAETLERRRRVQGDRHPDTRIAMIIRGLVLLDAGDPAHAEPLLRLAHRLNREQLQERSKNTIRSAIALGELLVRTGKHSEAIELLSATEAAARQAYTSGMAWMLARLLSTLGRAYVGEGYEQNRFELASAYLLEAHRLFTDAPGPTQDDRRRCLQALAELHQLWNEAEPRQQHDLKAAEWRQAQ